MGERGDYMLQATCLRFYTSQQEEVPFKGAAWWMLAPFGCSIELEEGQAWTIASSPLRLSNIPPAFRVVFVYCLLFVSHLLETSAILRKFLSLLD